MTLAETRQAEREAALGKACPYCGHLMSRAKGRNPTRDHVHPRALGGDDHDNNILIVCNTCNGDKGCLTLGQFYGVLLANGDDRAGVVSVLIDDAAEFDKSLGAQFYADAGVVLAFRKRRKKAAQRKQPKIIRVPAPLPPFPLPPVEVHAEQLERERIVLAVTNKLGIERELWSLADRAKQFSVLIGSQTLRCRVTTAERLEDAIVIARLRIERDRIDCRPKIYIPRLYGEPINFSGASA